MGNEEKTPESLNRPARFALLGASGFVAPRHMASIKACGGELIAACDPHDSVGILDSHFPECEFFTEIERFDRHLSKLQGTGKGADYISICTPNYLHDSHARFALRLGAHAICEKPLTVNPWNIDELRREEDHYKRKVFPILQLRYHPVILKIGEMLDGKRSLEVKIHYVTRRGNWYDQSWKGRERRSGGICMNIGVHFFDVLLWLFGDCDDIRVDMYEPRSARGSLLMERATVDWFLSVDARSLREGGRTANRIITIDGQEMDFTAGFEDLHTLSYSKILDGEGWSLTDAEPAIGLVYEIRRRAGVV